MSAHSLHHSRIRSVDILRGIVMILMALDHTRDYFSNFYGNPTDLSVATTGMFFTRWITHFCAPIFIFLAGTSAYLSLSKKQDKNAAALFLIKRGIWLIILEMTVVRFGWLFNIDYTQVVAQVIWAIGWSMMFLAVLIYLPFYMILLTGLLMIFGHNMLDSIKAEGLGGNGILWHFLHEDGLVTYGNNTIFMIYPIIPWIGVMATGYCFGKLLQQEPAKRNKQLYLLGASAVILFIVLRAINVYGDPMPWTVQESWHRTLLSFINCEKYPPSLLYLLMTLGPAILAIPLLENMNNRLGKFFTVYGCVPLFYYILHIYLIHGIAIVWATSIGLPASYFTENDMIFAPKAGWGFELPIVYMVWVAAILLLYYPCRWFMRVKQNNKKWWLSYL